MFPTTIPFSTARSNQFHFAFFSLLLLVLCCFGTQLHATAPVLNLPGDTTIEASICDNETYTFNGSVLDQPGTYEVVLIASDGTDSTVTLILQVLPTAQTTVDATICEGETYSFNG